MKYVWRHSTSALRFNGLYMAFWALVCLLSIPRSRHPVVTVILTEVCTVLSWLFCRAYMLRRRAGE